MMNKKNKNNSNQHNSTTKQKETFKIKTYIMYNLS